MQDTATAHSGDPDGADHPRKVQQGSVQHPLSSRQSVLDRLRNSSRRQSAGRLRDGSVPQNRAAAGFDLRSKLALRYSVCRTRQSESEGDRDTGETTTTSVPRSVSRTRFRGLAKEKRRYAAVISRRSRGCSLITSGEANGTEHIHRSDPRLPANRIHKNRRSGVPVPSIPRPGLAARSTWRIFQA